MQQPFDDDWDDLDDYDIEQCVIKENEILSQNPDLLQKTFTQQQINVSKESKDHWVNGKFNAFTNEINIPKSEFSNSGKGIQFNDQKNNGSGSFSKPYAPVPKKQSFYKPLPVGPSTSFNSNDSIIKEKKTEHETELKSLKNQLEQVLKEKAKLEEENLIKQGEVCNLRYELKRKETSLETERVDQCIALEAAEKRGKEKAKKTITELELKVKSLERDLDRLEGNLIFKNREVDELLAKCKQSENQKAASTSALNGTRTTHFTPSPKKRKLEDRFSPTKTHNFADKFDFGDKKKIVKSVQVQTEQEVHPQTRPSIKISTRKGRINGSRKAFYLLNNSKHAAIQFPSTIRGSADREHSFLSQMISSEVHQADSSEHLLVKHACSSLENLLKATQNENPSVGRIVSRHDKKKENVFMTSSLPLLKILSVAKSGNENVGQDCIKILALCIDCFLTNNEKNISGIISSLESLSFSIKQCADIPPELCNTVVETMKRCCDLASFDVVPMLISSLNLLSTFEIFRRKTCVNITGQCLLKKFCALLKKTKRRANPKVVCDDLVIFISQFLQDEPNKLFMNNVCQCSTFLLTTFVNNLYLVSRLAYKDAEWQYVFKGLKVLHTWQKKDRSWLEKVSQSNTYSLLLSTIIKEAKLLRAKGVLDQHMWELIYEIYEIDDPPS